MSTGIGSGVARVARTCWARLRRGDLWSWLAVATGVILAAQLGILVSISVHQYERFNLSFDFAIFHQAWHQIAGGDLGPESTLGGYPFLRSHLEVLMWPLAVSFWLNRNDGLTLLILTCIAVVAIEAIAIRWIVAAGRRHGLAPALTSTLAAGALVLFVANPWPYRAIVQDFHFQAIATCFAIAAAYDLWSGRTRRAWVWFALALASGDVAASYIAAVGAGFALVVRTRRVGVAFAGAGIAWVGLVAVLGANKGSATQGYAYLAGTTMLEPGISGIIDLATGVVTHPGRVVDQLRQMRQPIYDNLAPTGFLGLLSPWTAAVVMVVLLENALNDYPAFAEPGFQSLPVYAFGITGTMLLLMGPAARGGRARVGAIAVLVALVAFTLAFDARHFHDLQPFEVSERTANELRAVRARTPDNAEVIATFGIVGRFAGREAVHALYAPGMTLPITQRVVVFVLAARAGNQPLPPEVVAATRRFVRDELEARPLVETRRVAAYVWRPTPSERSVTLPTG